MSQPSDKHTPVQDQPTDANTEVKAIDGEDFGPVSEQQEEEEKNELPEIPSENIPGYLQTGSSRGAVNDSKTDDRKNVNGDPNIIQGNKLHAEINNDPQSEAE